MSTVAPRAHDDVLVALVALQPPEDQEQAHAGRDGHRDGQDGKDFESLYETQCRTPRV